MQAITSKRYEYVQISTAPYGPFLSSILSNVDALDFTMLVWLASTTACRRPNQPRAEPVSIRFSRAATLRASN
jgi:hypothetical protein